MSYANVITGHIGHFLVRMSRLTFAEGLFVIFLSICPIQMFQQDIFDIFSSICPICLTQEDIFSLFSSICPILFFLQPFYMEQ